MGYVLITQDMGKKLKMFYNKTPNLNQGPLITDGRNRFKWAGLYVGLS